MQTKAVLEQEGFLKSKVVVGEDVEPFGHAVSVETERMYTLAEIKSALSESKMEFIGAYSDFDFNEASDGNERIYIVARCKKEGDLYGEQ